MSHYQISQKIGKVVFLIFTVLISKDIAVAESENVPVNIITLDKIENFQIPEYEYAESSLKLTLPIPQPYIIAAPENFDPLLKLPPPPPPTAPSVNLEAPVETSEDKPSTPNFVIESITPNFSVTRNSTGQINQFIEQTMVLRTAKGDRIKLKTGYNSFQNRGIQTINNIPIQLGWEGKIGTVNLGIDGGIELFNRLSPAPSLALDINSTLSSHVNSEGKLQSLLVVSGALEYEPYKFNAKTLENQIQFLRFRPSVYWQISPTLSFLSFAQIGSFNDGNREFQSFSRLEKKIGQFSLAANLFNWSFSQNLESSSGYFSPPDFLVYNAEIAWQANITKFLQCKLSGSLGEQRLNRERSNARVYQAVCTVKLSSKLEADLGYTNSNIHDLQSSATTEKLAGQLRLKF